MIRKFSFLLITLVLLLYAFSLSEKEKNIPELSDPNSRTDTFEVIHYTVNLIVPDLREKQLSGIVDLQIQPLIKNIDTLTLDLSGFTVDSIWIEDEIINDFIYDGRHIKIPLFNKMNSRSSFVISVFYHGSPTNDPYWGGFYFNDSVAYNMGVGMGSYPHGVGRYWYPCVDNFVDRATYEYLIRVPLKYKAICPGELVETYFHEDSTITWYWSLENEIPTYLSSVAIGNYDLITDTLTGTERKVLSAVYVRPDLKSKADFSFSETGKYLSVMEKYFGPFKWQKIGFIGVPFFGGAMEHATNIALSESTITGDLKYETLYFHELAHSWFGNLVTCRTSKDMWLNEGWASYCEALFINEKYSKEKYIDYVRENHFKVLMYSHLRDNGMRAVYGIPKEYTYGSTVYDKGSDVVHTLRNYLGDNKFFPAVRTYLDKYSFDDASTEDLKNILSEKSGTDLDEFFRNWVYTPGFSHFSVDTFSVTEKGESFSVNLIIDQDLKGTDKLYNKNRLEVTFMNDEWERKTKLFRFSGKKGEDLFKLRFKPTVVLLDMDEKISDAITGYTKILKDTGDYNFKTSFFRQSVHDITDSALVHVEYHWVIPDTLKKNDFNGIFLKNGYWSVNGIFPGNYDATGYFRFFGKKNAQAEFIDNSLIVQNKENIVLLYRKYPGCPWSPKNAAINIKGSHEELVLEDLEAGDYMLGELPDRD